MRPWTFVHAADIYISSPQSYRYDPFRLENWAAARRQMTAMQPDLVLLGGDLTYDGDPHEYEFEIARDDFAALPFPYFCVPGNVDVGNKPNPLPAQRVLEVRSDTLRRYALYFGSPNWSFVHKNVRFTGFCAEVCGSGLHEEELFWHFLERLPQLPRPQYHVAMTHYALFVNELDDPPADPHDEANYYNVIDQPHRARIFRLLKEAGVNILLSGHMHCRRPEKVVEGIRFYRTPAVGGREQFVGQWPDGDSTIGFHRLDVTDDGIVVTFVPVQSLSTLEPRGPRGHFYTNDHAAKGFPDAYDGEIPKRRKEAGLEP